MKESEFQARIVKFLRMRNALVFNFSGSKFQRDIPDLHIAHAYWSGWMELKVGHGKLTPGQLYNLEQLRERGQRAYVVRLLNCNVVRIGDPRELVTVNFKDFESLWAMLVTNECKSA